MARTDTHEIDSSLARGLAEVAAGQTESLGGFAQYAELPYTPVPSRQLKAALLRLQYVKEAVEEATSLLRDATKGVDDEMDWSYDPFSLTSDEQRLLEYDDDIVEQGHAAIEMLDAGHLAIDAMITSIGAALLSRSE